LLELGPDEAIGQYLEDARHTSRRVNEIDNRGSTFYFALAWAKALAAQVCVARTDLKSR
jgi:isocitrate dehydrogenase